MTLAPADDQISSEISGRGCLCGYAYGIPRGDLLGFVLYSCYIMYLLNIDTARGPSNVQLIIYKLSGKRQ